MDTIWVFGDQLHGAVGPLATADPARSRVLIVDSMAKLRSKVWHRQRAHLVLSGLAHLAEDLRRAGFHVDHRRAPSLAAGLAAHRAEHDPSAVVAMAPASAAGRALLDRLGVRQLPNEQFLCAQDEFSGWLSARGPRRRLVMEDFYRWQRRRLGYLMDGHGEGATPAGGRWNFDHDNRQPPPRDGADRWPAVLRHEPDAIDRSVERDLERLEADGYLRLTGAVPDGTWATSRAEARRRLDHAIEHVLPAFGPHEDAMLSTSWHLAHTLLSPYLNLGLLHPAEVCDAAEAAYRAGRVPIASAEGFIRQIIGWREYVWALYWHHGPDAYRRVNALHAHRPLPPLFHQGGAGTEARCLQHALADVDAHGWTHHIQRLMLLGNLALLAGVEPVALTEWMWANFVDGAEWVMLPNVIGMATHADGGAMATKPYASGGAYIDRMSDYCGGCRYDRRRRTGEDACPFTVLYWDFLARHRDRFARNPRMAQQVRGAERLADLDEVRAHARVVLQRLDGGRL